MVNSTNATVAGEFAADKEKKELAGFAHRPEKPRSRKSQSRENSLNDDVIVSLSGAYENERARQVTEWERLRRQTVHYAA